MDKKQDGSKCDYHILGHRAEEVTAGLTEPRPVLWIDVGLSASCWLIAWYILVTVQSFPRLAGAVEVIGSDFAPRLLAYCMIVLGMWLLWSGLISRRVEGDRVDWGICLRGKALLLLLVLVYKVVLPLLTFVPSTIALVGASLWLFGERSIKTIASLSIITSLLIYYIFSVQLKVPLP